MSKLYLITGPAGVGKSTISRIIAESKEKSALIEGDEIYNFIKGGYISPWLEGNHLDVFWENCVDVIHNFLKRDYVVVFNYIIGKDKFETLKHVFSDVSVKFIVLMVDEETIIKRDKERREDWQMGERAVVLLNEFKNDNYDAKYVLDTSKLSVEESVNELETNKRFVLK